MNRADGVGSTATCDANRLLEQAERCLRLAAATGDKQTRRALTELAFDYRKKARELGLLPLPRRGRAGPRSR